MQFVGFILRYIAENFLDYFPGCTSIGLKVEYHAAAVLLQ